MYEHAKKLERAINRTDMNIQLRFKTTLRKFMKGAIARIHSGQLAEDQLATQQKAELERAARKKGTSRVIQKGGVLYVKDARERIAARHVDEVAKAEAIIERARKSALKEQEKLEKLAVKEAKALLKFQKEQEKHARKEKIVVLKYSRQ